MAGELCSSGCGFCGMCDADYAVRCETPGCDQAVTFPETDVYCQECRDEQSKVVGRISPDAPFGIGKHDAVCVVRGSDYAKHWGAK